MFQQTPSVCHVTTHLEQTIKMNLEILCKVELVNKHARNHYIERVLRPKTYSTTITVDFGCPLSCQGYKFFKCCPKERLVQIKMAGLNCLVPSLFCKRFQFVARGKSFD